MACAVCQCRGSCIIWGSCTAPPAAAAPPSPDRSSPGCTAWGEHACGRRHGRHVSVDAHYKHINSHARRKYDTTQCATQHNTTQHSQQQARMRRLYVQPCADLMQDQTRRTLRTSSSLSMATKPKPRLLPPGSRTMRTWGDAHMVCISQYAYTVCIW